ncbi:MAG: undecaprenyl-diphosphate phosphatase [Treponema sp.]|nr:undecaprenyl-diphosphate phosphatase [Treponema sp.]
MTVFQGIILGFLQGVAEFLPISSSGHLQLCQTLFGLEEVPVLFDVFLHLATLASVCLYFRKKIWNLLKIFGRWIARKPEPETTNPDDLLSGTDAYGRKAIIAIIISTIITGAIGVLTSKALPDMPIKAVCAGLIVTAFLLILSDVAEKHPRPSRFTKLNEDGTIQKGPVNIFQAVAIGNMQGFGTLPGISRSGSTIAGALFTGMDRKTAGDYSFIVSIPAILGAFILELKDLGEVNQVVGAAPIIAGCAAAFAVGYISLTYLMKLIRKGKIIWFAAYLIPVGILGLMFF